MLEMAGGDGAQYRFGFAGDTLNTAWYARALLGEDWSVDYVTALGDDLYSDQMRTFIAGAGIGTSHIQTIAGKRPGLYLIHQADGDRHFTYWRDTSAAKLLMDDREAVDAALAGADLIYFSGITMAILLPRARGRLLRAIVKARDAGARVAFDPNVRPRLWTGPRAMRSVLTAAASISDFVLPTHSDEVPVFGDADPEATAARYLAGGAQEVVVKEGAQPALVATATERESVAPKPGAIVVDATGAGDSFNGAYLSARLNGASLREAAEAAHAVAGVVIGHRGALVAPELVR
ncbi:MAG TPA: sugar kinase [Devosiaceae bacterium]